MRTSAPETPCVAARHEARFYDVEVHGWSLDDKRTPLLPEEKLRPVPKVPLTAEEHTKNNLPDILARWRTLPKIANRKSKIGNSSTEAKRPTTAQSFVIRKSEFILGMQDLESMLAKPARTK